MRCPHPSRLPIAAVVTALLTLGAGLGAFFLAALDAETMARPPLSLLRAELIPGGEIPNPVPEANFFEGTGARRAGRVLVLNDLTMMPRPSFAYSPPASSLRVRSFWYDAANVTASIYACAGDSQAIALRCGDFVGAETELDLPVPIALAAPAPRADLMAAACAGPACGPVSGSAPQDGNAGVYASLAGRFDVSAAPQLQSLPAPQSGWFDLGYTSTANPQWKQSLGVVCEATRPAPTSALGVQCGLPSALNIGVWRMSFQAAGFEGAFSARDWHVNVGNDNGISVLIASAMQTPLDDFNVDPSWGMQVNVPGGSISSGRHPA